MARNKFKKAEENINFKHGMSRTKTYKSWLSMRERCNNPNRENYKNYGGRGIIICDRWISFDNFIIDMGERPNGKTLDRINNNKGYSKENCRWATNVIQGRNQRIRKDNTSGVRGVTFVKPNHYRVRIKALNKNIELGYFKTLEEAKIARRNGELKYW